MVGRKQISEWTSRSIPVLLVAFLWAGLWRMWPENVPQKWRPVRKPFKIALISEASAMELVDDPTAFAFDSRVSYQPSDLQGRQLLRMPGMPQGENRFLNMSGQVVKSRARASASEYTVWDSRDTDYRAAWPEESVFVPTSPEKQLVIEASENLASTGYQPGEFTVEELQDLAAGWEARVVLDIDKTGAPVHVLIEKGSGNEDIDALVVRKILSGSAGSKEVRGGRLKISYGFE